MADEVGAPPATELVLYQTEDGRSRVQVRLEGGTVWLSQALLAGLYETTKQNISLHIQHIFEEGELDPSATVKSYLTVQQEGARQVRRVVEHYNLEVILAVGYRVRSHRGTQFRRWATERLREYVVKGFVLDDERLKAGRGRAPDYFDELLERIRDIRTSEKRFYEKLRDLWKLAIDYDPKSPATREFFQIAQNKLHFATTHKTAAEIIAERSDPSKPNMGLTSWAGAKVRKGDVAVAKNYLNEAEVRELNLIVSMYLDYAEDQAKRRRQLTMKDWREKLDAFLGFNDRDILTNAGSIGMDVAKKLAEDRYDEFHRQRLVAPDDDAGDEFDVATEQLVGKKEPKS
jgi:hypothetical protein